MSNLKKGYVNVRLESFKDNIVVSNAIYIHYKNNNAFQILLIIRLNIYRVPISNL